MCRTDLQAQPTLKRGPVRPDGLAFIGVILIYLFAGPKVLGLWPGPVRKDRTIGPGRMDQTVRR